jgi:uncharacterized protein (TIGR02598 family)
MKGLPISGRQHGPDFSVIVLRKNRLLSRRAFSLVEVTLAMGIISFAMITMLGLIPSGLVSLRHAIDTTTESQIVQKISAESRLTKFSLLNTQYSGATFYYDEDGTFLTNTPASAPAATRYWVTATIVTPSFPGSGNAPSLSPLANSLQAVSLKFISASSANSLSKSVNTYVIMVPNAGS